MHPPSRARRILKWTGVGLSLIILAAWIASLWWQAIFVLPGDRVFSVTTTGGTVLGIADGDARKIFKGGILAHGWYGFGLDWPEPFIREPIEDIHASAIKMPFWPMLLFTAIPTAWLWHRDRRLFSSPPDHLFCRGCGYDLTGNLSGVCPECGDKVHTPAVLADRECGEKTAMANSESKPRSLGG